MSLYAHSLSTALRRAAISTLFLVASAATTARADDDEVKQVYTAKCQICHMADGNAPIPDMNFADGKWLHGSSTAEIVKVIEDGVPGKAMVPFKAQLTPEQIQGLAKLVRSFDKSLKPEEAKKPAPPPKKK